MSRAPREVEFVSDNFEAIVLESTAEELREIIEREGNVNPMINGEGDGEPHSMTALVVAIRSGNEVAARVLLESGAEIEAVCLNKDSGRVIAADLALEFNADLANKLFSDEALMKVNREKKSARYEAAARVASAGGGAATEDWGGAAGVGYDELCSSDYGKKEEELLNACLDDRAEDVEALLAAGGISINATEAGGQTALFYAVENPEHAVAIIEILKKYGFNFDAIDRS